MDCVHHIKTIFQIMFVCVFKVPNLFMKQRKVTPKEHPNNKKNVQNVRKGRRGFYVHGFIVSVSTLRGKCEVGWMVHVTRDIIMTTKEHWTKGSGCIRADPLGKPSWRVSAVRGASVECFMASGQGKVSAGMSRKCFCKPVSSSS